MKVQLAGRKSGRRRLSMIGRRCWGITILALALSISFPSRPVNAKSSNTPNQRKLFKNHHLLMAVTPEAIPPIDISPSGDAARSSHRFTLNEIVPFREVKEPPRSPDGSVPETLVEEITSVGAAVVEHATYLLEALAVLAVVVAIAISFVFLLAYIHVELGRLNAHETSIRGSPATTGEITKSSIDVPSRVS
jgi:hypothetical protein